MYLRRSKDKASLVVDGVVEAELEMLRSVRDTADPTSCPAAEARLYPDPMDGDDDELEESNADWREFVVPDLRTQFDEALDQLEVDLGKAAKRRRLRSKDFRFEIPMAHVPQWYMALNQARLVLQEKYKFPEDGEIDLGKLFSKGQGRAYFQSRFYAELQCWLLEMGDWQ